jgi:putative serine/threonine protein kinase
MHKPYNNAILCEKENKVVLIDFRILSIYRKTEKCHAIYFIPFVFSEDKRENLPEKKKRKQ